MPILVLNLIAINQSIVVPLRKQTKYEKRNYWLNFKGFRTIKKYVCKIMKFTCSNNVRCESPLSASGSGNFSDGTQICSCGSWSWRHSSSTISAKWSSSGGYTNFKPKTKTIKSSLNDFELRFLFFTFKYWTLIEIVFSSMAT